MGLRCMSLLLGGAMVLCGCSEITDGFGLGSRDGVAQLAEWRCGNTGPLDLDADGYVQAAEWASYSRAAYSAWDEDVNGRVTRAEFERCWGESGFFPGAQPASWETAWTAFNPDGDDYLDSYEFWGTAVWTRLDANRNGIADPGEWTW